MKILHLIDSIKPGGAENVMCNYIKVCNELGDVSTIVGAPGSKNYETTLAQIADIDYVLTKKRVISSDAIFIHSNHQLIHLLKFILSIKRKKIRVLYIQHLNYSNWKYILLSKLINYICTDFIQITPIIEKMVHNNIRIPVRRVNNFYINKYPEEEHFFIRKSVRQELNMPESTKLVTFSAIFKPGKGLKDFINLATEFIDNQDFFFLVLGDGEESSYVKDYPHNNLLWLGKQTDVEKFLIASDLYVFTSKFSLEMMPMALIEAINVGIPCVAYSTDINNFLLNNYTSESINKEVLLNREFANSKLLLHYDREYGLSQMKELLHS